MIIETLFENLPLVRKKRGGLAPFEPQKIALACKKALLSVGTPEDEAESHSSALSKRVTTTLSSRSEIDYNDIHDLVELHLMDINKHAAKAYIIYRSNQRDKRAGRDALIESFKAISKEISKENANIHNCPSSKMYEFGSEANKHYVLNYILSKEHADAHVSGDIHIHDAQ